MAQGSVAQWLGNVAQWVGALLTAFGIFFALFKEETLGWFWPPELVAEIKAEHPIASRLGRTRLHQKSEMVPNTGFGSWSRTRERVRVA